MSGSQFLRFGGATSCYILRAEKHALVLDCGQVLRLTERVSARFFSANHPNDATIIRVDTDNGSVCLVCDWEHDFTNSDADLSVPAPRDTILAREETKTESRIFSYDEDHELSYEKDCGLSHATLTLKEALRGCALMLYDGMYTETLWTRTQKADRETGC